MTRETSVATDRTAQLEQLRAAYVAALDGLLAATARLEDEAWGRRTGCPGWDVHDQLAHCIGLERRLLGDPDLDPDVAVPDAPHVIGVVNRYTERDVQMRRGLAHGDLVAEARDAFSRRVAQLGELRPEQLDQETVSWFGPMRTSAWLRVRLFDLASHERDIRAAAGRLEDLSGPYLPIVVEHVLRAWSGALPHRIEGDATVTLVVGDGPSVSLDLGSGELLRGASAPASTAATLHLTPADALALAGGRSDAPQLGDLDRSGDEGVLTRFVAAAGVTP